MSRTPAPIQQLQALTPVQLSRPWHELSTELTEEYLSSCSDASSLSPSEISLLREKGEAAIISKAFLSKMKSDISDTDRLFYENLVSSGTHRDKSSAFSLLISSNPIFYIPHLKNWMNWIKGMRRESKIEACGTLAECFVESILPERKLLYLEQRKKTNVFPSESVQLIWFAEDSFKRAFAELILLLESLIKDPLTFAREKALSILSSMLSSKPEQEAAILKLLVSRLADSDKKISGKASFCISQVLKQHPAMSLVVIDAVWQEVVAKSSASSGFYGLVFLTQIPISGKMDTVVARLIQIYLSLFEKLLEEKKTGENEQQKSEKLIGIVLSGLNRALSVCRGRPGTAILSSVSSQTDALFRLVHFGSWNKSLQALWILLQIVQDLDSTRFFRTLYESLFDERVYGASSAQQEQYIKILRCSLTKIGRGYPEKEAATIFCSFLKRWLSTLSLHSSPFVCASLMAILGLVSAHPMSLAQISKQLEKKDDSGFIFDPSKRDPLWSGSLDGGLFELEPLLSHYHPSVAKFAADVLRLLKAYSKGIFSAKAPQATCPDPFESFSTHFFLDRFVYRQPKKTASHPTGTHRVPVSSKAFSSMLESQVPLHERFFHRYFKTIKKTKVSSEDKSEDTSDAELDGSGDSDWSERDLDLALGEDDDSSGWEESVDRGGSDSDSRDSHISVDSADEASGLDLSASTDSFSSGEESSGSKKHAKSSSTRNSSQHKKKAKIPLLAPADDYLSRPRLRP